MGRARRLRDALFCLDRELAVVIVIDDDSLVIALQEIETRVLEGLDAIEEPQSVDETTLRDNFGPLRDPPEDATEQT